jgi:branched-chain amino acid transport system substrate-binding protein
MTFDGLSLATIAAKGGAAARFADAYQARYGAIPTYLVMYGVAAMQVVLAAIAKSDGTRRGVTDAVFHGAESPSRQWSRCSVHRSGSIRAPATHSIGN